MSNQNQNLEFKITIDGKEATGELSVIIGKSKEAADKIVSGFENVRDVFQGIEYGLKAFSESFGKVFQDFREFENSTRKLNAASKITGTSLDDLNKISSDTKEAFKLSKQQANEFTIVLSKLTQKAGDLTKTQGAIAALLDLGAGQGLSAEQSLVAINQALLGIDEGTDKLFQKNPSVIYAAYAKEIGTTAGMLTDQQKAQALLNEVLSVGGKLLGQYENYLNTAGGQVDQFSTKTQELGTKVGEFLANILTPALIGFNDFISLFQELPGWVQGVIGMIILLTFTLVTLNVTGLTGAITSANLFIFSLFGVGEASVVAATGLKGFFLSLGPIGWAVIGITALATAWGLFADKTKDVKQPQLDISKFTTDQLKTELVKIQADIDFFRKNIKEIDNGEILLPKNILDKSRLVVQKQLDERIKDQERFNNQLLALQKKAADSPEAVALNEELKIRAFRDGVDKSISELNLKYDREKQTIIEKYGQNTELLKSLEIARQSELKKIEEKYAPQKPDVPVQELPSLDNPVPDSPTTITGSFSDYKIEQVRRQSEAEISFAQKTTAEKIALTEQEISVSENGSQRQTELLQDLHTLYIQQKREEFSVQLDLINSIVDTLKQSASVMSNFLVDGFTRGFKNIENGFGKLMDQLSQIFFTQLLNKMIGRGIDLLLTALGFPVPVGTAITGFASGGVVRAGHPVVGVIGEGNHDEFVSTKPDMISILKDEIVPELFKSPQFNVSPVISNQFTPKDFKDAIESADIMAVTTRRSQAKSNAESDRYKQYKLNR